MNVETIKKSIDFIRSHEKRKILIEISGGITFETIRDFALPGVDYISVGALTHSVFSSDLSLTFRRM